MKAPRTAWCGGCLCEHLVDRQWRSLWVDSYGRLLTTAPLQDWDLAFIGPDAVMVCGDGSALRVMERYLSEGTLQATLNLNPENPQPEAFAELT